MSIPLLIPKAHASKQYDGSSISDYSMARLVLNNVFKALFLNDQLGLCDNECKRGPF